METMGDLWAVHAHCPLSLLVDCCLCLWPTTVAVLQTPPSSPLLPLKKSSIDGKLYLDYI